MLLTTVHERNVLLTKLFWELYYRRKHTYRYPEMPESMLEENLEAEESQFDEVQRKFYKHT